MAQLVLGYEIPVVFETNDRKYKGDGRPHLINHNVYLYRCYFGNNITLNISKNILATQFQRIDRIKKSYWTQKFQFSFYESQKDYQELIYFFHDLIEETLEQRVSSGAMDTQQKICLIIEIAQHLQELHKQNIAHQQLTPYTIGWVKQSGLLKLVLYGFNLYIEKNLRKPRREQDEIDYAYRDPQFKYQENYDFLSSQLCKQNDIWSFGVVIYYIFTQKDLFENSSTNQNNFLNPIFIDQILQDQKSGSKSLSLDGKQILKTLLKNMLSTNLNQRPNIDEVLRQLLEIHKHGYLSFIARAGFCSPFYPLSQPPQIFQQTQQHQYTQSIIIKQFQVQQFLKIRIRSKIKTWQDIINFKPHHQQ